MNGMGFGLTVFSWLQVTSVTIYPDGTFECFYRGKSSIAFAAVALLLLLVAQLIVTITTRCLCCARSAYKHGAVRTYAIVAFIISWYENYEYLSASSIYN